MKQQGGHVVYVDTIMTGSRIIDGVGNQWL